jgi:UDP-2,3-diacylglucosamine hydrolase
MVGFIRQTKPETKHYNYFYFGHRSMVLNVGENLEYVNLGDWIGYFTYGVFLTRTLS